MKKAFTLIELLVVIAIIAILAAILFPVFTQAKTQAKKATSISNLKQVGLAFQMYANDSDDMLPRQDDCVGKSSLNPAHNNLPLNDAACFGGGPYYFRTNHYSWQKWVMPYVKNVDLYFHPAMTKDPAQWNTHGEIFNGYALNLALTGALDFSARGVFKASGNRQSFLGGSYSSIPSPSDAMLVMELASTKINFLPTYLYGSGTDMTAMPAATRELWAPMFYKWTSATNCTPTTELDPKAAPFAGQIVMAKSDGSAKAMPVARFLAETPTGAEFVAKPSAWDCGPTSGARTIGTAVPAMPTKKYPLWGLE